MDRLRKRNREPDKWSKSKGSGLNGTVVVVNNDGEMLKQCSRIIDITFSQKRDITALLEMQGNLLFHFSQLNDSTDATALLNRGAASAYVLDSAIRSGVDFG